MTRQKADEEIAMIRQAVQALRSAQRIAEASSRLAFTLEREAELIARYDKAAAHSIQTRAKRLREALEAQA
ncbi:MAG: hypothetical protein KIT11_05635 [Fimbriimonadaceae bacterium]|nr:hypothetical protein [Fimbriimonadaceae bacterium]QYK56625.1 MAG: hypothetical protein KF733_03880 [Fimbriimonadaceae bacterium]